MATLTARVVPPRWSPLVETALYVGAVLVADVVWGAGDRFTTVEPHPFWAIVVLMAAQYGTTEGLVAAGASSVALLAWNLPAQSFEQSVHEYVVAVALRPVAWMAAALVVGELRVRHRTQYADTVERLQHTERRLALLTKSHGDLSSAKDRLETRLAGQLRTATSMFEAARSLETLDPGRVLDGATDLLTVALNAKRFSLFLLHGDGLVLHAVHGGAEGGVERRYGPTSPLYAEVVGAQRFVTVASPAGEAVLAGHGLMAGPLVDPVSGKLYGMVKVEDMHFLDFNLGSIHTLKSLCGWIAAAYGNALSHKASQLVDEKTQLYGMRYFERQTAYLTEVALRFGFDLTLLTFRLEADDLSESDRHTLSLQMAKVARTVLRRTDLVFSHDAPSTQFAVLLPGALPEHAFVVTQKLVEGLRAVCGRTVPHSTNVRALCRARDASDRDALRADAPDGAPAPEVVNA